jgi:BirA family biotin operon repressor/biotin-[acetyl-CoA-carboxylase] ligase
LAESRFDRTAFEARLTTATLGRTLSAVAEVGSTNDAAWEALAGGAPSGWTVVADAQPRGRGRAGRAWHLSPGKGLALSVGLIHREPLRSPGLIPLAAGLALAAAFDRLGVPATLKWPNDLLLGRRKLAGILAESRRDPQRLGRIATAVVVGVGVNLAQEADDFPPALRGPDAAHPATSLALEGFTIGPEAVAAAFLNAFEPLWEGLLRGEDRVLEGWRRRAGFWGETVRVRVAEGWLSGVATALDDSGALVIALADGRRTTVLAGDLELVDARPAARS